MPYFKSLPPNTKSILPRVHLEKSQEKNHQTKTNKNTIKNIHPGLDQELPGPIYICPDIQQEQISRNTIFFCSFLGSAASYSKRDGR